MEQDVRGHDASQGIRLAMKHPGFGVFAISNRQDFDYYALADYVQAHQMLAEFGFDIVRMANKIQVERILDRGFNNFKAVDCTPTFHQREIKDLEDLIPFRPVGGDLVYVDPNDTAALLEFIKKNQEPKQAEIRERIRKENDRRMLNMGRAIETGQKVEGPYENIIQLVKVA